MISAIGSGQIDSIKMMNTLNAFKAESAVQNKQEAAIPELAETMNTISDNILKGTNINEIQDFAKIVGENDLTEGDIKYGLQYGRSVIAEFIA
jgi:hypothetical protein